jgi:integrase
MRAVNSKKREISRKQSFPKDTTTMTKPVAEVTARTIARLANEPGRHPVKDAKNLKLKVLDAKRRYWTMRYRIAGHETEISLGAYVGTDPTQELKDVLKAHAAKRALLLEDVDPQERKRRPRALVAKGESLTFGEAAEEFLVKYDQGDTRNAKHRRQWRSTLGGLPEWFRRLKVDAISPKEVYQALETMWRRTPETASRLRGRIEATLEGVRAHDDMRPNPAAWSGWLKTQLGTKRANRDLETGLTVHHRALPHDRIPGLMAELGRRGNAAARALAFAILTAGRSGEVRGMTWDEIKPDYRGDDNELSEPITAWIVPARRMKMFRRHRVPLSRAATAILEAQERERGDSPFVFPGARPMQPLVDGTLMALLRGLELGRDTTVHGLRASFRSWCKAKGVPFQTAESALAHVAGGKVVQAYDRDDQLALRVELMEVWSRHCLGVPLLPAPTASPRSAARTAAKVRRPNGAGRSSDAGPWAQTGVL